MGDPNFPEILNVAKQGERIFRCQKLFEDYSRLGLSNEADRPVAIDGLQQRLLRTMDVKGGFGILEDKEQKGLFRRFLLWCRGSDMGAEPLTRIKFPSDRAISFVPSWSWMAYTGRIDYLKLDFAMFDWADIESPWSSKAETAQTDPAAAKIALKAEAQNYEYAPEPFNPHVPVQKEGQIIFDNPNHSNPDNTQCVVLGIHKGEKPVEERMHYLIVVKATNDQTSDGTRIYERVGAGYLPGRRVKGERVKAVIH